MILTIRKGNPEMGWEDVFVNGILSMNKSSKLKE
jgi:hypothetical protein